MDKEAISLAENLIDFINHSPVSYFASKNISKILEDNSFQKLNEDDKWNLIKGEKYYIERNNSSVIAFVMGEKKPWDSGFNIVGAHTDSPLFKIKNESLSVKSGLLTINIEVYGGAIISSWLDRELSIAGRVSIIKNGVVSNELIDFKRPVAFIPNLAIHLNRDVNKGFEYNKQTQLSAILTDINSNENGDISLKKIVATEFDMDLNSILELDLFLYDTQKGLLTGLDSTIISSGRIDNLAMCHSILTSITQQSDSLHTSMGLFFDNEEIGSQTMQGADSNFLISTIERIIFSMGGTLEDNYRARSKSFLISADGAHAQHPNFSEKHDSSYSPIINKGPVIKLSANYRYATTSESAAKFILLCQNLNIPYQKIVNRSDIPSGSTIGPMTSANLGINTVDVGNPMLAMHSIREYQGVLDHFYMTKIITSFFNTEGNQ